MDTIIGNHIKWVLKIFPMNACGMRYDLSGDMFLVKSVPSSLKVDLNINLTPIVLE